MESTKILGLLKRESAKLIFIAKPLFIVLNLSAISVSLSLLSLAVYKCSIL